MSFVYPQVLFGLFALAIPVIIHLFNFRRTRKIYFSSTQFLEQISEESTSKIKVKHWLILLSRLLFIFFLVMAFAQPFLPASNQTARKSNVFMYLDNSFSMSNEVAVDTRAFDEGVGIVNAITDLYPPETRYVLLTNDFLPTANTPISENEVKDLLTETTFSGSYRNFEDISSRFINMEERGFDGDWFFISDFQNSTIGELQFDQIDSTTSLKLLPLQYETRRNLYVDTLYLKNPFNLVSEKVEIVVELFNSGNEDVEDAGIKVFIDDTQTAGSAVSVPAGQRSKIEFDLGFTSNTISEGRILLEEYPVTFDNEFYFTLDRSRRVKVFEIREEEGNDFISDVYGNESLFNFTTNNSGNINYSNFNEAEFIILNSLERIPDALGTVLINTINNGVPVLFIPSSNPDLEMMNRLSSTTIFPLDTTYSQRIAIPDFSNPFYDNVFEEEVSNMAMFDATPLVDLGQSRTAVLTFRNGKAFLSKMDLNNEVYMMAAPLDNQYNGFQNHALFVALMYKLAFKGIQVEEPVYHSLNTSIIEINLDTVTSENQIYKLKNESLEWIPDQRVMGKRLIIEIPPEVIDPGFYYLSNDTNKPLALISFNSDKRESLLAQKSVEELESISNLVDNVSVLEVSGTEQFIENYKSSFEGTSLWKYALIFTLLFLMTEILLIRFYK